MEKELIYRKCSHCGNNGHNSTCNATGSFKLFGVWLDYAEKEDESIRKSNSGTDQKEDESIRRTKSLGNLEACNDEHSILDSGYHSDGLSQSQRDRAKAKAYDQHDRKKGLPWTESEHRSFLVGLEKQGKGDWKGISKNFVPSRTPTQVASHAQKYFLRMAATEKKKRRTSLFDMPFKEPTPPPQAPPDSPSNKASEISQQASTSGHATTSERPPLSPMARPVGIPHFRHRPFMMGVPSNAQSFHAPTVMPTVSFVPVMNFPNQGYVYLPNSHGNFTTSAPFMPQSSSLLPKQPTHGPYQAGPATSVTEKDAMETGIGALSI